jgi:ATP-dependent helicase/nuclease subunit A
MGGVYHLLHMPVLQSDSSLRLPNLTVLKASAGSGKTYALTQRYAQFLLSRLIPRNDLRNVLAITFSNNAARDMREKVLEWLKKLSFRDPERLAAMAEVTDGAADALALRAEEILEDILARYSDFQVVTIDSFMSAVFRASAIDFGYSSEFEIVLEPRPIVEYAFNLFLRGAQEGSARAALLDTTIRAVLGMKGSADSFPWDPTAPLLREMQRIGARLARVQSVPMVRDTMPALREAVRAAHAALEGVARLVETSGLEPRKRSPFPRVLASARAGRIRDLVEAGMKTAPMNRPKKTDAAGQAAWNGIQQAWEEARERVRHLTALWARAYYEPYLRLYSELAGTVDAVKRSHGTVFIDDLNRSLAGYISAEIVPDVYFRIGERVWHFLVDEFQDTSPLQWHNLFPLVENSLAVGGSLFVVGDTKQAIYGFRDADYRIMKTLQEANPFPSAGWTLSELSRSWRSRPRVLELAGRVFRDAAAVHPGYREAARRSGLDAWRQEASSGSDAGYAEVRILERSDDEPPERAALLEIMEDLRKRGYAWGDIAVLASRNEQVVRATTWLNERGIPFVSYSSLDVRSRRVAQEMLALLAFLDAPPDDLAFATFVLGDIFARALEALGAAAGAARGALASADVPAPAHVPTPAHVRAFLFQSRTERPLYKAFQRAFPALWKGMFAELFRSAGYLPLYDLVSDAYARFDVFSLAGHEEATLARLLEAVKELEGSGANSLRAFLDKAADEGGEWSIHVPFNAPSVRAMTVHKAKGLGFPVVIVLLYGETSKGFPYAFLEERDNVGLVKVTDATADADPVLRALYDEEVVKERVNRLNALYVSLTRAKREVYVIGVKRKRDTFPFDILPADEFSPRNEKGSALVEPLPTPAAATLSHQARPVAVSFTEGALSREERRRGELAHRMLSLVEYARPDLAAQLAAAGERAAREARLDPAAAAPVADALVRLLQRTELGLVFQERTGRAVFTEKEFCDAAGRLVRMDRVVVDADGVTVIDFKTGEPDPGPHEAQLRGYQRVLSDVYPGLPVEGVVAYVDHGGLWWLA